ncbi:response regulator transcription factor [Chitinophaga cymbidii]|uniref:DNA-binding response regulator n=1 Tax=Chitinophaga cymbidii TaxID=1096750 RepID=A0A512RRD5_9BACT|nr:response regulator transcription factor [Chitinophaga cymbidii]GEP98252.1 DNA-binding response regulator [Chitinophaga cymbidii]
MTRVLIVEDEIIIARFIELQLKAHFNCQTAIAISAAEALAAMPKLLPHLLLCDINLEESCTGIQLVRQLQRQYTFEVIYISSYNDKNIIEEAIQSDASNYIIKPVDEMQLYAGVRLIMEKLARKNTPDTPVAAAALNPAEQRIVQLISLRKSTKEIAEIMFLSPYTVKNQRHKICRKLGLKDENNALLKWALENGEKLM